MNKVRGGSDLMDSDAAGVTFPDCVLESREGRSPVTFSLKLSLRSS